MPYISRYLQRLSRNGKKPWASMLPKAFPRSLSRRESKADLNSSTGKSSWGRDVLVKFIMPGPASGRFIRRMCSSITGGGISSSGMGETKVPLPVWE